jgi:hypothetical protein
MTEYDLWFANEKRPSSVIEDILCNPSTHLFSKIKIAYIKIKGMVHISLQGEIYCGESTPVRQYIL